MGPSRPTPSGTPQRRLEALESRWQTLFCGLTKRHLNLSESTCTECLYCPWHRCYSAFEQKEDTQEMADLPTGTVTFLFTDVEGSTNLWERYPLAMQAAIARHDEILREVMDASDGFVFKTVGDAFCVAFSSAPYALEAALAAQRALLFRGMGEDRALAGTDGAAHWIRRREGRRLLWPAFEQGGASALGRSRRPGLAVFCYPGVGSRRVAGRDEAEGPGQAAPEGPLPSRARLPSGDTRNSLQLPALEDTRREDQQPSRPTHAAGRA